MMVLMVTKIMMMDYDEDVDKDDLIAAAGAASSRPLKVLPGPCKCSPQLHDLSHLVIISVKAMVMTIMISIIVLMIVVLLKCSMLIVTTRSPKAPSQTQAPPTLNRAHISPNIRNIHQSIATTTIATCSSLSGPPLGPGSFEPRSLIAAPDLPPRLMP